MQNRIGVLKQWNNQIYGGMVLPFAHVAISAASQARERPRRGLLPFRSVLLWERQGKTIAHCHL